MTPKSGANGGPDRAFDASSATTRQQPPHNEQQHEEDMIGSLSGALSGVDLGSSYLSSSYHQDRPASGGTGKEEGAGTGGVVDWGSTAMTGSSAPRPVPGANPNAGTFSNGGQRVPSRQTLLFGTDMQDLHEPTTTMRTGGNIDLFLSQSPSQTLGEEVLQLQHTLGHETIVSNQGGLNGWSEPMRAPGAAPKQDEQQRRRIDSPNTSVTGASTSSRSVSPSLFGANPNTIQAFHGRPSEASTRMDRVGSSGHLNAMGGHTFQPSGMNDMHSGVPMQNLVQMNQQPGMDPQYMQQQPPHASQQVAAAPQVLYMAVPTPDGRGQMLQPVQMLQLPGGAQTFVLPNAAQFPTGAADVSQQQPMMVLPSTVPPTTKNLDTSSVKQNQWSTAPVVPPQYARNGSDQLNGNTNAGNTSNQYSVDRGGDDYSKSNRTSPNEGALVAANTPDAIASLYAAPQRPPLDALLGHVRRLSRDQVGCRLLQQALDEEGPMAATLILNEGISFWGEAMVDPFGNYLFQKILEKITAEERIMLIKSVSPRLVNASLNLHGTRSVQKVVELCAQDEAKFPDAKDPSDGTAADILTTSLSPAAARLCIDSHGNHVIQRILLKLGHRHSRFVFDAVAASVGDVARHRHGCCVIQRCLDSPPSEPRSHLVRRIVEKSLELMQDAYGNYVVQYVLDVCGDDDVHAVCESVVGKVCLLAIQKFSSNVMEKCLERCTDRVKEAFLAELSDSDRIRELMMDPFGNYVVQRALSVATHTQAIRLVEAMRPHLISSQPGAPHGQRNGGMRNTAGGRRIMAKICRRFPNFTLTAMGSPEELYSQHKGHNRKQQPQQVHHQPPHQQQVHHHQPPQQQHHHLNQQQQPQAAMAYHQQAMSPLAHHQAPPAYGGSPHHQGQHVSQQQANMRQPYFDVGQGYYDQHAPPSGHQNYHPHM
jgi:hypothetical protein